MTCSVRILSTTSLDSSPGILLVAPNGDKTLVNCGEGCQRVFLEFSQKLSSVHRVCLTHLSHTTLGGLPGMILTSADVVAASAVSIAKQKALKESSSAATNSTANSTKRPIPRSEERQGLDIIGPEGIELFVHSLRHFMRREAFDLRLHSGEYYQRQEATPSVKRRKPSSNKHVTGNEDFHVQSIACKDGPTRQVLSYIFTSPPIQGKFLVEKAKDLGIPRGPLYAQLKAGKAVTFVDPTTGLERRVESCEVVEVGSAGVAVAILFYPTKDVLEMLQSSESLSTIVPAKDDTQDSTTSPCLELVVHITSKECFESMQCQKWRQDMNGGVQHVFLTTDLPTSEHEDPGTPFHSTRAGAACRAMLSSNIFIPPLSTSTPELHYQPPNNANGSTHVRAVPLLEYTIIPRSKKGFSKLERHQEHREEVDRQMHNRLDSSRATDLAMQLVPSCTSSMKSGGEIIFTGTGSAVPCKHRNVSGIYLQMVNGNAMLLDVGEGTVGQLLRAKYQDDRKDLLRRLRAVWISHPHADHHLGILRLLAERQALFQGQDEPMIVIAPPNLARFLKEYEMVDPLVVGSYIVLDCQDISRKYKRQPISAERQQHNEQIQSRLRSELKITGIQAIPVQHCAYSYAVELRGTSFGTVAYSGDCRPSRAFAEAAQNADLLIHEATFTDDLEAEAALKRHSTVGEALEVAIMMKAKHVVLTHFSQRYPKIPPVSTKENAASTTSDIPVVFAFDYMKLTPGNLLSASKITPAVRLLYPEESSVDEDDDDVNAEITADASALDVPGLFAQNGIL